MAQCIEQGIMPGQKNVNCLQASPAETRSSEPKLDKEKDQIAPTEDTKKVALNQLEIAKQVTIGTELYPSEEADLLKFLQNHEATFAWSASDLQGVDRKLIEHELNIDPMKKPRKQKLRKMSDDKIAAVRQEVDRLLKEGVIRKVQYPTWLANAVMVMKKNGKWRMCIDFTDLNKACPKDDFPLPRIDKVVDDAASSEMLSLLDCFSGYHQIWLKKEDE